MNYDKIIPCDTSNGTGYRVSLFISGGEFNCYNYCNKNIQTSQKERPFTESERIEILTLLKLENITGLSILGGNPLEQGLDDIIDLNKIINQVHYLNKDVWLWTEYKWEELFKKKESAYESILTGFTHQQRIDIARWNLIKSCDVVIDGRFISDLASTDLKYRSSMNQRVIDAKKSEQNVIIYNCY